MAEAISDNVAWSYLRVNSQRMGRTEPQENKHIIRFLCACCHVNVIYIKVMNQADNDAPFDHKNYTCTECNLMPTELQTQAS